MQILMTNPSVEGLAFPSETESGTSEKRDIVGAPTIAHICMSCMTLDPDRRLGQNVVARLNASILFTDERSATSCKRSKFSEKCNPFDQDEIPAYVAPAIKQ